MLHLPPRVSADKLEELMAKAKESSSVPLSSSAPQHPTTSAALLWAEPEVEEFVIAGLDEDDGCLFALDDEDEEEEVSTPVSAMMEFRPTFGSFDEDFSSRNSKHRQWSPASAETMPETPPLSGFAGSPVLHACLMDIHREKRARANSRDATAVW